MNVKLRSLYFELSSSCVEDENFEIVMAMGRMRAMTLLHKRFGQILHDQ